MENKMVLFRVVIHLALFAAFIAYYISLYCGNDNNISTYTNLILIFTCSGFALDSKKNIQNKCINYLTKINGILLLIWIIVTVIRLFI